MSDSSADRTQVTKLPALVPQTGKRGCMVVIYGNDLGKKYDLSDHILSIGRANDNSIVLDDLEVSRNHCVVDCTSGRVIIRDNKSTNGVIVNGQLKPETELRVGDHIQLGGTILKFLDGDNVEALYHEEIYRLTITDGLTNTANKRFFLDFMDKEVGRVKRYGRPLSLMLFDIDHFKKINDTFGHIAGDAVLRGLAGLIRGHVRQEECFARYGGEEFALAMPETTLAGAVVVAEKLRTVIETASFEDAGRVIPVTISIGVASYDPSTMAGVEEFIAASDAKLYEAKQGGRNRVCW